MASNASLLRYAGRTNLGRNASVLLLRTHRPTVGPRGYRVLATLTLEDTSFNIGQVNDRAAGTRVDVFVVESNSLATHENIMNAEALDLIQNGETKRYVCESRTRPTGTSKRYVVEVRANFNDRTQIVE